jgi:rod shape determining protein RodA
MAAVLENQKLKVKGLRDFDWPLALLAMGIVSFGVWQIYNAQPDETYWQKQIVGIVIALTALLIVSFIDYRRLIDAAPIFYAIGIVLLVMVLIPGIGLRIKGQQNWIRVPVIGQFQPSEFVKIPVILMLAKYFGARKGKTLGLREVIFGLAIMALPLGLIMLEPDVGQAITYFPILGVMYFLSGIKIRWVLLAIVAAVVLAPAAYIVGVNTGKIKPYQQERIKVIFDPDNVDPKGYGYHTVQSMVTVGKGGLTGSNTEAEYSQSALKFLPEPHTDFIFAVTAEHTGFIGCISLLFAYLLLISRLISGARQAPDREGMLVIMSIAGAMIFQIFMNVGMALGFLPVIGVPLPMMSAGLSSVLATFIVIGFVISVKMRRFVN